MVVLLERVGAEVVECACVIELPELKVRAFFPIIVLLLVSSVWCPFLMNQLELWLDLVSEFNWQITFLNLLLKIYKANIGC